MRGDILMTSALVGEEAPETDEEKGNSRDFVQGEGVHESNILQTSFE